MKQIQQIIQKTVIERWWLWLFLLFFLFIFQIGNEKPEQTINETPKTNETEQQSIVTTEKIDASEFKRIQSNEELKSALAQVPTIHQKETAQKTKEKEVITKDDEKKAEQQTELQRKWDVKNGLILSENLTLDLFTAGINMYLTSKERKETVSAQQPIVHDTSATIYYEYTPKEHLVVQANATSSDRLIKNITVKVDDLTIMRETFDMLMTIISVDIEKEEREALIEKIEKGTVHKFQTKRGIVYQWTRFETSGILTIMKQKS